jgi:hypothetical protein
MEHIAEFTASFAHLNRLGMVVVESSAAPEINDPMVTFPFEWLVL